MERASSILKGKRGFTLVEAIAVLMILGILSAVVVSRVSSTTAYNLYAEFDQFKTNFRFVQVKALSDNGCVWGLSIDVGTGSYTLVGGGNLPLEGAAMHSTINNGVTISAAPAAIYFDDYGIPYTSLANCNAGSGSAMADTTITMTEPSGGSKSIIVTANTGYLR